MHKLLESVNNIFESKETIEKVNNYNFENHDCIVKNEIIKVNLEYSIKHSISDEVIIFGMCPHCKALFYNRDFVNYKELR